MFSKMSCERPDTTGVRKDLRRHVVRCFPDSDPWYPGALM